MPGDLGEQAKKIDWRNPPGVLKVDIDLYTGKTNIYFGPTFLDANTQADIGQDLAYFFTHSEDKADLDFGYGLIKYTKCPCATGSLFVDIGSEKKSLTTKVYSLVK